MNTFRTLCTAALLSAAPLAQAIPFAVATASFAPGPGYGIDGNENGGTLLNVQFSTAAFAPQNFALTAAGQSFSFTVGTVNLLEPNANGGINANELDGLGVSAVLGFTSPTGAAQNVNATGTAVGGSVSDSAADYTLAWSAVQVAFGAGGLYEIDLSDLTFSGSGVQNATATVTLLRLPTSGNGGNDVPAPGTLALLGAGLAGAAALRRRGARR